MEYTAGRLAALAGVSARTLRHYDAIGLLKPARTSDSGYRIYGRAELERLQQILLYRELGMPLEEIRAVVTAGNFDPEAALERHRERIAAERKRLGRVLRTVDKTLRAMRGEKTMSDTERFEGLKRGLVDANEKSYGAEARAKYGDAAVERANTRVLNMTREEYDRAEALREEIGTALRDALLNGDCEGELARRAIELHREWLALHGDYSDGMYLSLTQMYVDDERFTRYYDDLSGEGAARFLRDAAHRLVGGE